MTRNRLVIALAAAMVAGLFFVWARPPRQAPATWRWPASRVARYQLHLEGESAVPSPDGQGTLGGALKMDGVLELARLSDEPPRLSLRLVSLDRATMTLFGAPAMEDLDGLRAALIGPTAVLTLFPTGDVKQVAFSEGAPTLFETTAQTLVSELQHPTRDEAAYTLVETTTRGTAEARWLREGSTLLRTRTTYFSLTNFGGVRAADVEAQSRFEFDADGVLRSLDAEETLVGRAPDTGAKSRLIVRLTPLSVETRAGLTAPTTTAVAPLGELKPPRDAREQMLAQRVAGLDRQGLVKGLADFAASAGEGGLGAFMARASGLLLQQPGLCADVVAWAREPNRTAREREFALEVLAAAGSPRAQAAMLELLGDEASTPPQVQRLSLLQTPTVETGRFVEARWKQAVGDARETLGLTLGAVSGQLARAGHPDEAGAMADALATGLRTAPTNRERLGLTFALGNAGLESHLDVVLAQTGDGDPKVRMAALHALRKTPTPAAHLALQAALSDESLEVARTAVTTLGLIPTSPDDRVAVMAAVRAGHVKLTAAPLVLNVLEPHVATDPSVRPFLVWLAAIPGLDAPIRRRITTMLNPESN
ncbi:MAG: HEAT repeat domain-containing protein [Myxococcaceae bacterium]|nr:HEAT repeat domain-containing protein [Myxococcaceae bacterium]